MEQNELKQQELNDAVTAAEAEKLSKEAEAAAAAAEEETESRAKAKSAEELEWVKRSRPGSDAKPGANLKTAKTGSDEKTVDEKKERDRVPESKRRSGGGSYFGESKKEKELAEKAAEDARKAQEKDRISAGAGDRRREVERKLSPRARAQAAEAAKRREEEEKEDQWWEIRARVARRFASPVEKVMRILDGPPSSFSYYALLGLKQGAEDADIRRAYRIAALRIHPGKLSQVSKLCL